MNQWRLMKMQMMLKVIKKDTLYIFIKLIVIFCFIEKFPFFFLLERDLLSPLVKLFPVSQHQNDPYVEWGMGSVMLVSNLQSGVSTPQSSMNLVTSYGFLTNDLHFHPYSSCMGSFAVVGKGMRTNGVSQMHLPVPKFVW